MDVRAFGSRTSAQKTLFSCAPSDGVKVFGSGRPPGRPRDIPPTFSLGYFSVPDERVLFFGPDWHLLPGFWAKPSFAKPPFRL